MMPPVAPLRNEGKEWRPSPCGVRFRGWPTASFEELHPWPFRFRALRSRLFFNWHQFVAALAGLTVEFGLESLFALGVSLRPNARIVFDLLLYHGVEDDRDLMGRSRGGPRWS